MADFPKLPRIKQDDENMEKLHCAARRGQAELVRRLIAVGIDPNIPNRFGCTALHLACKHGQTLVVTELAGRATDLSHTWHGWKPLHLAVQGDHPAVVSALVEAARQQQRPIDQFVNELDEYEVTELFGKPKSVAGQTPLHYAVNQRNVAMIRSLIALGANPSAKDRNGDTVLVRCVQYNLEAEFELLVAVPGVRLDASDRMGRTALHWALLSRNVPMAKRLLELGAETNIEDQNKESPMLLMAYTGVPSLLEPIVMAYDSFAFLQLPLHNQMNVLPERFHFKEFVEEPQKVEIYKIFEKKLNLLAKEREAAARSAQAHGLQGSTGGKKGGGGAAAAAAAAAAAGGSALPANMTLAPSAPVRKA